MNTKETVVTQKGTTTIPEQIRRATGISPGAVLVWSLRNGVIEARKKNRSPNALQRHIRERAGTWDGDISGVELLKKTRP
jgi:bifunctional DNA-binding transcriptional regulator/antitoxin component of YhaV-PrlF toxin-antitoxin module